MKINMVRQTKMFASLLNIVKLAKKPPLHFKWTENNKHPPKITIQMVTINLSGVDRHNIF